MTEPKVKVPRVTEPQTVTFMLTPNQVDAFNDLGPIRTQDAKKPLMSIDAVAKSVFIQFLIQASTQKITNELTG